MPRDYRCDPRPLINRMIALVAPAATWAAVPVVGPALSTSQVEIWALSGTALCVLFGGMAFIAFRSDSIGLQRDLTPGDPTDSASGRGRRSKAIPRVSDLTTCFTVFKTFMFLFALLVVYFLTIFFQPTALAPHASFTEAFQQGIVRCSLALWLYTFACMNACDKYSWNILTTTRRTQPETSGRASAPAFWYAKLTVEILVGAIGVLAALGAFESVTHVTGVRAAVVGTNVAYFLLFHYQLRRAYAALRGNLGRRGLGAGKGGDQGAADSANSIVGLSGRTHLQVVAEPALSQAGVRPTVASSGAIQEQRPPHERPAS